MKHNRHVLEIKKKKANLEIWEPPVFSGYKASNTPHFNVY